MAQTEPAWNAQKEWLQQGHCRVGLNGQAKEMDVSNVLRQIFVIQFLYGNRIQRQSLNVKGHIDSKRP